MTKQQKDIKENILAVIQGEAGEKMKTDIRIVEWIVGGKVYGPYLEKRQFSKNQNGGWRMGKAKGFSLKEYKMIVEQYPDLEIIMSKDNSKKDPF